MAIVWHGEAVKAELARRAAELRQEIAGILLKNALEICPVDTGALGQSAHIIEINDTTSAVVFGNEDVQYAAWVEFGSVSHPEPNPFLRRAIDVTIPEAKAILKGG